MPLQIRRGNEFDRTHMATPLATGELLYVTDQSRLYVGDGTTLGGIAVTGFNAEDAIDAIGAALVAGTHQNITFTYDTVQDIAGRIDATVSVDALLTDLDLNTFDIIGNGNIGITGGITSSYYKGTIVADDSTILVDGVSGRIVAPVFANVTGNVTGNLTGNVTGNLTGNVTGNVTGIITGLTGSSLTGTTTGYHIGDVTGSIFGVNSSVIVDATENSIHTSDILSDGLLLNIGSTSNKTSLLIYGNEAGGDGSLKVTTRLNGAPGLSQQGPIIRLSSVQNTIDLPDALNLGDSLGSLQFGGYVNLGAEGNGNADLAAIKAIVGSEGDLISEYARAKIQLFVANGTDPNNAVTAEFSNAGILSAPVIKTGSYATGSLPSNPTAGMIVYDETTNQYKGYVAGSTNDWVVLG